jgi:type II secretory pathway component GspD/PulD (secretin)
VKKTLVLLISVIVFLSISLNLEIKAEAEDYIEQPSFAEVAMPTEVQDTAEAKRISLSLRDIEVVEALKFFSVKTGLNIIPTQKVTGRVTLTVNNAIAKDVFDIMLRSNKLAYEKRANIYNVMTEEEYKTLFGKNFSDARQVIVFRLKYAIPQQAFNLLEATKSEIGRLLVEPESGTIMIMDTPAKIEEAQKILDSLEQKSDVKIFTLQYAKAKDVEEQLKAQLELKNAGTVKSDERTNQVIVQTFPERMKNIEELIAGLDKKTKAVLIDTKIIRIQLSDQLDKGVQWEGLFDVAKQFGMTYIGSTPYSVVGAASNPWMSRLTQLNGGWVWTGSENVGKIGSGEVGSYPSSATTGSKVIPGEAMHIGIVDAKRDFDVMIKYLQTFGKTRILSNPSLSVVNNHEAKIHIGERRAYVTTTTTTGTTSSTVSEDVTYLDIGVKLSITPMINDDGYVTMKVKPEISSIVGEIITPSKNVIPILDTSECETTVIAKDGATIMLGGLGREEKVEDTQGVPILRKIPFIGFLFSQSTKRVMRSELIILLTPIIFEGDKLITAKDKEDEMFGAKPVKKFDVFKEEIQRDEIFVPLEDDFTHKELKAYPGSSGEKDSKTKTMPIKEELTLKGLRSYTEKINPQQQVPLPRAVSMQEDKSIFIPEEPKGFKSYN